MDDRSSFIAEMVSQYQYDPSTASLPSTVTATSIATTVISKLSQDMALISEALATQTQRVEFRQLVLSLRGAQVTQLVVSAEQVAATATDVGVRALANAAIYNATLNLIDLENTLNLYNTHLNRFGNVWYLTIFSIIMVYFMAMVVKSRYWWFNVTMICGYSLEWMGFLGRVLSFTDNSYMPYYLLQYVALTIAPAFIMGAIYFLFAQLVVIHGRSYSVLKPLWYLYFFVACDIVSLVIQAGGGGSASMASSDGTDEKPGIHTMLAGIVFQVFSMTVFFLFWFEFLHRIWFRNGSGPLHKRLLTNIVRFMFNTKLVQAYREQQLEPHFNHKFAGIRHRKLFNWAPLAVTVAVLAVYIRSIYRVVELSQGFSGYLITHEVFLFVLDAMMITICGLVFLPFHPVWLLGTKQVVRLATIKQNQDEGEGDSQESEDSEEVSTGQENNDQWEKKSNSES